MAKTQNTKLKLLYLTDILNRKTDETHTLSANELCSALVELGVDSERKSIYKDIDTLRSFGVDVILSNDKANRGYFVGSRKFELAELRLLLDAVQAANFITPKKTKMLVEKIESFASEYQAKTLHGQVYVDNRPKCDNEELFYTISSLDTAINLGRKVRFIYSRRIICEDFKRRTSEKEFIVSPYALIWSDDHYYLVCNNEKYDNIMNLRIDRIRRVLLSPEKARDFSEVSDYVGRFDSADYASKLFNMYSGDTKPVELICENNMLEPILDRFGERTRIQNVDGEHFCVKTNAGISDGLISWILQFGGRIKVKSPNDLKNSVKKVALDICALYDEKPEEPKDDGDEKAKEEEKE